VESIEGLEVVGAEAVVAVVFAESKRFLQDIGQFVRLEMLECIVVPLVVDLGAGGAVVVGVAVVGNVVAVVEFQSIEFEAGQKFGC